MQQFAILIISLLLFACASTPGKVSDNAEFRSLVEDAEEAIDKAAEVGGEWRDSRLILQNAKNEAQKGNLDKAMQLAEQAKIQGEMGFKQAKEQEKIAAPWLF